MSSTALPLELFRSVIEDISSNRDLCSLARVSHFIQREAEARIYRRIEAYGIKDITHICRRILASPRRGPYVFALALQEYRDCKHVLFAYWGLISRVLALMPNLRDLTTYLGIRSCATVFKEQHTFQLTSFKSHFLFDESLVRFFESQPQLRRLTIYHSVYTPEKNIALPLPSHILPHLIALDASSFITKLSLTIVNGRPVTYLSLNHFPKSEQSIEVLSRSAPTMKALYISETPLCNGMHEFPYTMPELEYLSRISVSSPAVRPIQTSSRVICSRYFLGVEKLGGYVITV
jgi:hypothetical protein